MTAADFLRGHPLDAGTRLAERQAARRDGKCIM